MARSKRRRYVLASSGSSGMVPSATDGRVMACALMAVVRLEARRWDSEGAEASAEGRHGHAVLEVRYWLSIPSAE